MTNRLVRFDNWNGFNMPSPEARLEMRLSQEINSTKQVMIILKDQLDKMTQEMVKMSKEIKDLKENKQSTLFNIDIQGKQECLIEKHLFPDPTSNSVSLQPTTIPDPTSSSVSLQPSKKSSRPSESVSLQPRKISSQLAIFCGVEPGTMISRTDATRKIAAYIKEHNLQNPENRREILWDAKLGMLFQLQSGDNLNYFNLQRYIKPHFIKEIEKISTDSDTTAKEGDDDNGRSVNGGPGEARDDLVEPDPR